MKLYLIVAHALHAESPWVITGWDEWSVDENHSGYLEALEQARERNPSAEIREAIVEVPDNFLARIFEPISVEGKV